MARELSNRFLQVAMTLAIIGIPELSNGQESKKPASELSAIWARVFQNEAGFSGRMARFTGYLEGAYGIEIPNWWRSKGRTAFSDSTENSRLFIFGRNPKGMVGMAGGDSVTVVARNEARAIDVKRVSQSGERRWTLRLSSLHPGFAVQGYTAIDCAVSVVGETVYVLGRNGETRFLIFIDASAGCETGQFAFHPTEKE